MKVKRFFSKSMQEALKMVRDDLGADAVILSNSRVDGGIEIVAALDYEETPPEETFSAVVDQGKPSPTQIARMHAEKHLKLQKEMEKAKRRIDEAKTLKDSVDAKMSHASAVKPREDTVSLSRHVSAEHENQFERAMVAARHEQVAARDEQTASRNFDAFDHIRKDAREMGSWSELSDMKAEIMELKGMLHDQRVERQRHESFAHESTLMPVQQPQAPKNAFSLVRERVEKGLNSLCLSDSLKARALQSIKSEFEFEPAWEKVQSVLAEQVDCQSSEVIDQGGVIALVGPTGSGKTTTIGKMAARYVMKYGTDSIALVTTDRYRIAAHEQLKVFGRILNVPVYAVDETHSLDRILGDLSAKRLVLVDTAGLIHTDSSWSEQLQELKLSHHKIRSYLVTSAVGQYQVMCSNYNNYQMVGLSGAIITKLDEAVSLGEVFSFLADSGLTAMYYTDGQRVPEDIHLVRSNELLDRASALLNSSERWVTITSTDNNLDSESVFSFSA